MSVAGIASSILSSLGGSQSYQTRSQQIQSEFQQLGQALQSGNLSQAQSDFTTLSQQLPNLTQNSAATTAATAAANTAAATAATATSTLAQTFAQLGQDLQSGNLTAAQQDYTTLQQDVQQTASQHVGGHHHHHHSDGSQGSGSSSSQQTSGIDQAFSQLEQTLQSGNLQGAQSAFATLQNDLQQIGGYLASGSNGTAASTTGGSLNVTA